MAGDVSIAADRQHVWTALNDPDVLRQCIPGCASVTREADNVLLAKVTARIGPIKAGFSGKVLLSELDPPNSYVISGEGSGGAAGFAKGSAAVKLTTVGSATQLQYQVDAAVGGKLAQIGARLIDSTARKMAEDFFAKFVEIAESTSAAAPATETVAPAAPPSAPQSAQSGTRLLVVAALVLLAAAAAYYLSL
ncbi:MAG: carbon monoxide dehydrogenase subunit G [Ferrovibrio sp.]|uniref:SRPBCC family protein n=1 Tax=Ferrovibrio sp. TaxID=1917215 RepID=UPI0026355B7C|nr:carbon monoxide dehydrogenase subunit G [Ferrovibrio sp.]MCW0234391.1 carbon monoxide dehydrogenase subunit G [Ferrovibrio sp.]